MKLELNMQGSLANAILHWAEVSNPIGLFVRLVRETKI